MQTTRLTSPNHQIKKTLTWISLVGDPDFQDPSTYLNILNPTDGSTLTGMGLDPKKDQALIEKIGLNQYKELLDAANAENWIPMHVMKKYADAQAWLTENAMVLPIYSKGGVPSITKVTPFSAANSAIGIKGETTFFKYQNFKIRQLQLPNMKKLIRIG